MVIKRADTQGVRRAFLFFLLLLFAAGMGFSQEWVLRSLPNKPDVAFYLNMAYDSDRGVMVLWGGAYAGINRRSTNIWVYDGTTWTNLGSPSPNPGERYSFAFAYDSGRHCFVLFGGVGSTGACLNDTWELYWNGSTYVWREVNTPHRPPPRDYGVMAYDASRGRMVLYGGQWNEKKLYLNDTWEYYGGDWHQINPSTKPNGKMYVNMVYDSTRQRIVLFGGFISDSEWFSDDTWEYYDGNWHLVNVAHKPPARDLHAMGYDPDRNRVVIFGGAYVPKSLLAAMMVFNPMGMVYARLLYNDTWEYYNDGSGYDWHQLTTIPSPSGRTFAVMDYDQVRDKMVLYGGYDGHADQYTLNETWELEFPPVDPNQDWTQANPTAHPDVEYYFKMVYDSQRNKTVLFAGYDSAIKGHLVYVWEYDGTTWTRRELPSTYPHPRYNFMMTYDSDRGKIVLFGGRWDRTTYQDTWEYDPNTNTWTRITTSTTPPAREAAAMVYDSVRKRVVLFGGQIRSTQYNDTWEYYNGNWHAVSTSHKPAARAFHGMAFDASRGRVVLFGGVSGSVYQSDTWEYYDGDWHQVTGLDRSPVQRILPGMTYDTHRNRVILFGGYLAGSGYDAPQFFNDTWEFTSSGWKRIITEHSPPPRDMPGLVYDIARKLVVCYGGYGSSGGLEDTWEFSAAPPDSDNDGLTDDEEATYGTSPTDPDSDNDGVWDGAEVWAGTDPLSSSSTPPSLLLPFVEESDVYRSNVGLTAVGGNADILVQFYLSDGTLDAHRETSVSEHSYTPLNRIIRWVKNIGYNPNLKGYVRVITKPGSTLKTIGGPIDENTDDPSITSLGTAGFTVGSTPLIIKDSVVGWRTQLIIANPNETQVTVTLYPYDANGNAQSSKTINIAAGGQYISDDLVDDLGLSSGFYGMLVIQSDKPVYGFVHQYNQARTGGIYPVYDYNNSPGEKEWYFPYIVSDDTYRSNIGFSNCNSTSAQLTIQFYKYNASNGQNTLEAEKSDADTIVPSMAYKPFNRVLTDVLGVSKPAIGYIRVTSDNPVYGIGGPLDETSGDPSVASGLTPNDAFTRGITPIVIKETIYVGWKTRLILLNLGTSDATVTINLYDHDTGTLYDTKSNITIKAGSQLIYDDVLSDLFGITSDFYGQLEVVSDQPLLGWAHQYTPHHTGGIYPFFKLQ
ncbi:MAG: hypothetical protein J7L64_09035 [Acidobacteria bacterium]|nr:hypothetical protein [Acidobacteriota bacterium]